MTRSVDLASSWYIKNYVVKVWTNFWAKSSKTMYTVWIVCVLMYAAAIAQTQLQAVRCLVQWYHCRPAATLLVQPHRCHQHDTHHAQVNWRFSLRLSLHFIQSGSFIYAFCLWLCLGRTPKNWLFTLTWRVTFTTARALLSSAVK